MENDKEIEIEDLFTETIEKNILLAKMLVFGLMVDGNLSLCEKKTLKTLGETDWFPFGVKALDDACEKYSDGCGLVAL